MYAPGCGRFLQRDSIGIWGDASNLGNGYAYCGDDPLNNTDSKGTEDENRDVEAIINNMADLLCRMWVLGLEGGYKHVESPRGHINPAVFQSDSDWVDVISNDKIQIQKRDRYVSRSIDIQETDQIYFLKGGESRNIVVTGPDGFSEPKSLDCPKRFIQCAWRFSLIYQTAFKLQSRQIRLWNEKAQNWGPWRFVAMPGVTVKKLWTASACQARLETLDHATPRQVVSFWEHVFDGRPRPVVGIPEAVR